jgi:hypothetical protein
MLANEVSKMIAAGHLRPGYSSSGIFDFRASRWCGDELVDYWHNPGDTLYALIRALPHLSPELQSQARAYLQNEFDLFPPYEFSHMGWNNGAPREVFLLPQDVEGDLAFFPPQKNSTGFQGWTFPPQSFYSLWKYAQVFGGAKTIFDAAKVKLNSPPTDQYLSELPNVHNAFIAGYIGYLELEKLAGYPESVSIRQELNRMLSLRAANFSKDAPDSYFQNAEFYYCRSLNASRNFMEMVPELAQYLNTNVPAKVQEALNEYYAIAPYWFVTRFDTTFAEGAIHHFYDYYTLFQARALFQGASFSKLARYLDVPAVPVGDLFYIHNLVTAIEAGGG